MTTATPVPAAPAALLPCPYPGIDPFSYAFRDVFYARDAEAEEVLQKLVLHRTILLYAESGVGKSSLLNAGVIPRAVARSFQPERIRVTPDPGQEFVIERIATGEGGYLPSLFAFAGEAAHEVLSADAFVARVRAHADQLRGMSDVRRPLLIFDQFEEWTTLVQDAALSGRGEEARAAQKRIGEAILSLVRDRTLPVKVMLAFREDYLGSLTPLVQEYPDLNDSFVRLEPLGGNDILDAVRGPFVHGGYSPPIPMELATSIRDEFVRKAGGGPIRVTEVQIVCERLYRDVIDGKSWLEAYEQRKGVQAILEGDLESRLSSLPSGARDQAVALLGCLLTADGTRNVVSAPTLLSLVKSEGAWPAESLRATLRRLEKDAHLIVQSARRGVSYFEIASEFLVPWIRARSEERRLSREREEAEQQQRLTERQHQTRVRNARVIGVLLAALAAAVLLILNGQRSVRRAEAVRMMDAVTQYAMRNTPTDPQFGLLLALHAASLGRRSAGAPTLASVDALRQAMAMTPRMRVRLVGHRGGVTAVDVSPGGEYIATASRDSSARIWDAETGVLLHTFDTLPGMVTDVAFSPDGRSVATASDDSVRVWDPFGVRRPVALTAPGVTKLAYSPDGRWLAVGDAHGSVRVWRTFGLGFREVLPGSCGSIASLAFSRNSERLVAGCADSLGPDRHTVAVVWTLAGTPQAVELRGTSREVPGVAFAMDDQRVVTAGSCCPRVGLWDAATGDSLGSVVGHMNTATGVAIAPGRSVMATVGRDRNVVIYDRSTRRRRGFAGHSFWIEDVAFFPDGARLVTGSRDSTAIVWDVAAPGGAQLRALSGHEYGVQDVAASADGRVLVSLDRAGKALWWDAATGDSLRAGDTLSRWRDVNATGRLALEGDRLVMSNQGDLSVWSVASRLVVDSLVGRSVTAFALASDSILIAFTADSSVIVRNLMTGRADSFAAAVSPATLMAVSPDGRRILLLPPYQGALIDARSHRILARRQFQFQVRAAAFSPDGRRVAVGGDGQAVELLDPDALQELRRLPHRDIVTDVAFNRSGHLLASTSRDGNVAVWEPDSGKIVATFGGHEDGATSVAFLPEDQRIVVGDENGMLRIHALDADSLVSAALDLVVRPLTAEECGSLPLLTCPTATDLILEGRRLALANKVPEATAAFARAQRLGLRLPVKPERMASSLAARGLVTSARFQLEADQVDSAQATFARATRLDSLVETRTMVLESAARHAEAGQLKEAAEILRLGVGPRWYHRGSQRDANLLNTLGNSFLEAEQLDEAGLAYGLEVAAVEALGDYDRATAYNNYAYLLSLKKQQLDSAATLVTRAIELGGADPELLDTKAWVEYQAGRCGAAVTPIDSALASAEDDAEIAAHYITIHCSCGDRQKPADLLGRWKGSVPPEMREASATFCHR